MVDQQMLGESRQLRVFLCHYLGDKEDRINELGERKKGIALELCEWLKAHNINVWISNERLFGGERWENEIYGEAIRTSDLFLVCLTKDFLEGEGQRFKEVREALEMQHTKNAKDTYVIVIRIERCHYPDRNVTELQYINYFKHNDFSCIMPALEKKRDYLNAHGENIAELTNVFPEDKPSSPRQKYISRSSQAVSTSRRTISSQPSSIQTRSTKAAYRVVVLLLVISFLLAVVFLSTVNKHIQTYEAESEVNTLVFPAYIEKCPKCSNGHMVASVGHNGMTKPPSEGSLQFNNVYAPNSGLYLVTISYCFSRSVEGDIRIDGSILIHVMYASASNECLMADDIGPKDVTINIRLQRGENTLKFTTPESLGTMGTIPSIDCIKISY